MAKVIEDSGSSFAFTSRTFYLSKDTGFFRIHKAEAEVKVKQWIENDELSIPDFDPRTIESLKGSLDYPSKGTHVPKAPSR
jgi:MscS family membrane protein